MLISGDIDIIQDFAQINEIESESISELNNSINNFIGPNIMQLNIRSVNKNSD